MSDKLSGQTLQKLYSGHGLVSVVFTIEPIDCNLDFLNHPNTHLAIAFKEKPDLVFFKALVKMIRSLPKDIHFKVIGNTKYNQTDVSLVTMPENIETAIDNFHKVYGSRLEGIPDKREHHFAGIAPIGSVFKATGIKMRIIENGNVEPWILIDLLLNWTLILKEMKDKKRAETKKTKQ